MESIWNKGIEKPVFDKLKQDIKTDVLVIGGGLAGLLCCYMLKNAGVDCVLVEADKICSGITKNTTAKITCQHGLIYDKMILRFGEDFARLYMDAQTKALENYRKMSQEIDCDFCEKDSFVYSKTNRKKIEKELRALEKINCPATFAKDLPLPFSVSGAVKIKNQAQFHPLKFAFGIAKNLPIFENTKVRELRPDGVICESGKIRAEKVIVATHFPFLNKHGSYFLKMYQHRSYVLALEDAPRVDGMYVDEDENNKLFEILI